MHNEPLSLILATASPYKKAVLEKLGLPFTSVSPHIDETALHDESPEQLVTRLAFEKAKKIHLDIKVPKNENSTFVIAADQVACFKGEILGKPGTQERAIEQLSKFSGKRVVFLTGLCLLKIGEPGITCVEKYSVSFKQLTHRQIQKYVESESPIDCAGSFKCEGKGILLFESMEGRDINSLVGLPLIALAELFDHYDIDLFEHLY